MVEDGGIREEGQKVNKRNESLINAIWMNKSTFK